MRVIENRLHVRVDDRQKIIGASQADPAVDHLGREALLRQPAFIQREHGRVVGAGAVAHDKQRAVRAAPFASVCLRPGQRLGAIAQKLRVTHLGVEPVVGDHGDHAATGQRLPDKPIVRALAVAPTAAVIEHHHGGVRFHLCWQVNVQSLARQLTIADARKGAVAAAWHQPVDRCQG